MRGRNGQVRWQEVCVHRRSRERWTNAPWSSAVPAAVSAEHIRTVLTATQPSTAAQSGAWNRMRQGRTEPTSPHTSFPGQTLPHNAVFGSMHRTQASAADTQSPPQRTIESVWLERFQRHADFRGETYVNKLGVENSPTNISSQKFGSHFGDPPCCCLVAFYGQTPPCFWCFVGVFETSEACALDSYLRRWRARWCCTWGQPVAGGVASAPAKATPPQSPRLQTREIQQKEALRHRLLPVTAPSLPHQSRRRQ